MRGVSVLATALALGLATPAGAGLIEAQTVMTGDRVVPAAVTSARGEARFTLNDETGDYRFSLDVAGIDFSQVAEEEKAGGLHVHNAPAGVNGPLVVNLADDRDTLETPSFGAFTLSASGNVAGPLSVAAFVDALSAGELYVALHTEDFLPGEIRGQLRAVPEPGMSVLLGSGLAALGLLGYRRGRAAADGARSSAGPGNKTDRRRHPPVTRARRGAATTLPSVSAG